jgi:prepilin-type processing-associated H-X9-DG protein
MRAPWPNPGDAAFFGRSAGTQGYRHLGRTNVVFCDGHAESIRQCYTDTDPAEAANIAPGTGFLSPDNSLYDLE